MCSLYLHTVTEIVIANHTFISTSDDSDTVKVSNRHETVDMSREQAEDLFLEFRGRGFNFTVIPHTPKIYPSLKFTHISRDK